MQKFRIESLFCVGDEVKENGTGREGRILSVNPKLVALDKFNYIAEVSYSVKPEKGYNQFRAKESDLREIVYDFEGNPQLLPEGMTSR